MKNKTSYKTKQISKITGNSRDALRYYEYKGIIQPQHNHENKYRQYSDYDIYRLMVADFYQKRGLSIEDIRQIQNNARDLQLLDFLTLKKDKLKADIKQQQYMLELLEQTLEFGEINKQYLNSFCFRKMPIFKILSEFSDFSAFDEYTQVRKAAPIENNDILSCIMRHITFDETKLLSSKMLIIEKLDTATLSNESVLSFDKCIYTVIQDCPSNANDIEAFLFRAVWSWAKEHSVIPSGEAFAITRLIQYENNEECAFLEIYIPVRA